MRFGFSTAGESHGPAEVVIVHGVPAGLRLLAEDVDRDLARRQLGYGRGGRQKIERDRVEFLGGVRHGRTLGSPVAMLVRNRDYANWERRMNPAPVEDPPEPITLPRPGHADLAGMQKYGFGDLRNVLERSSARETVARVAAGAVARRLLGEFGVRVFSAVYRIGEVAMDRALAAAGAGKADRSEVRCPDPEVSERMKAEIDAARHARDALGGEFVVVAEGCPPGLGSYADWRDRLDARLAAAVVSINAIKGVEIGDAFEAARRRSSEVQDEIVRRGGALGRASNRLGGLEGGMTNGEPVVVAAAMKPISTIARALRTVDLSTGEEARAFRERADSCAVPAAAVIGEAMVAVVLAEAFLEKFGADALEDIRASYEHYMRRIGLPARRADA
ncbi:chorismate synthase [Rubrobacter xylanophilus DSM 9941]|uniref:Chorismate synthase n=1 Tax=Rubrobacter xylanophilus (strain DSM 9941 / JCM 11954 / NBRC 16129 / PRD-1) TaxID=266117 RepID=AROC_RUBXD|nr:chorismate synthase [Rubrobacter xylanophilus]Q1AW05.1 RecName: Full=Chorismate synthase; Short=CS; AltName: Full=5-enolpyruvylshikimate-3-phosphate phospholyase [Rubrobacter xylanophilus DSM 9941]ABG04423.1 chorismate synthase [Rubrobacter xylanophilus DSM 9941]